MSKLADEIQQTKPFDSIRSETYLSIQRTAWQTREGVADILKRFKLTPHQYNVLRILRGAGKQGLKCSEISKRMVTHDSDITRLLDRLEKASHIRRLRSESDRRVVRAYIEKQGLSLLTKIDPVLLEHHEGEFAGLNKKEARTLIELLEKVRKA